MQRNSTKNRATHPRQPDAQTELLPCVCCGRSFPAKDLAWHREGLLCPDCLRERESCGCSD